MIDPRREHFETLSPEDLTSFKGRDAIVPAHRTTRANKEKNYLMNVTFHDRLQRRESCNFLLTIKQQNVSIDCRGCSQGWPSHLPLVDGCDPVPLPRLLLLPFLSRPGKARGHGCSS